MLFNKDKRIIFIDVDDTLADTRKGIWELYTSITGKKAGDINIKSKRYMDFCPEWTDENIEKIFETSIELYKRVKPMPGAVKAIETLISRGYDVRVATMHKPSGIYAKQQWLETYFPNISDKVYYIDVRISNKDIFREYGLIDDDLKNIKGNNSGLPILLDIYNIYPDSPDYIKCKNWEQVLLKLV